MIADTREFWVVLSLGAVLLACAPSCGVDPGEASPAAEWLERVAAAEKAYSFEGVREVSSQCRGHSRTKWYFDTHHPGRATVSVSTGTPTGRQRRHRGFLPRLFWLKDRDVLLRNYRVAIVGREEVAERAGVVLEIRAVTSGRPSVRMIADEETGLLLGMERRDYRGEVIYRSKFTTLLIDTAEEQDEADDRGGHRRWSPPWGGKRGHRDSSGADFMPLVARYLPEGFQRKMKPWSRTGSRRFELFSDGLCWLSMSQRAAPEGAEERVVEQRQWGDRVVLEMVHRGVKVKVTGGLDPEELLEMIRSLAPAEQEEP